MAQHVTLVAAGSASLVVAAIGLTLAYLRLLPQESARRSTTITVAIFGIGFIIPAASLVAVPQAASQPLVLPLAMLAALSVWVVSIPVRAAGSTVAQTLAFAALWSVFVAVPTSSMATGLLDRGSDPGTGSPTSSGLGSLPGLAPIDHGGTVLLGLVVGASVVVLLIAGRSAGRRPRALRAGRRSQPLGILAFCFAWTAWLVLAELEIGEISLIIAINAVLGAIGGCLGWLLVQRVWHRDSALPGIAAGLICGLFAISPGASLLSPLTAIIVALLGGAVACALSLQRIALTRRVQWFLVGPHLAASGIGLFLVGIFADGIGFAFTGQLDPIGVQVGTIVLCGSYGGAMTLALWFIVRTPKRLRDRRSNVVGDTGLEPMTSSV